MIKKLIVILIFLIFLISRPVQSLEIISQHAKEKDGLKYSFIKAYTAGGRVHIHLIEALPAQYEIKLVLARNKIGYSDSLSAIAKNNPQTLAAVNGTFFCMNWLSLPISNIMIDGEMIYLNNIHRANCGISKDNKIFFGVPNIKGKIIFDSAPKKAGGDNFFYMWGMNRVRKTNETIVYTPYWGETSSTYNSGTEIVVANNQVIKIANRVGNNKIPKNGFVISLHGKSEKKFAEWFEVGQKVRLEYTLENEWKNACQIFTGGPRLLKDGENIVAESIIVENFKSYLLSRHPRTAIGIKNNGAIILMAVDGRSYLSAGATYNELSEMMRYFGAAEAMGLDGGNSTAMWFDGQIVNRPSGGGRLIPNAIITLRKKN